MPKRYWLLFHAYSFNELTNIFTALLCLMLWCLLSRTVLTKNALFNPKWGSLSIPSHLRDRPPDIELMPCFRCVDVAIYQRLCHRPLQKDYSIGSDKLVKITNWVLKSCEFLEAVEILLGLLREYVVPSY